MVDKEDIIKTYKYRDYDVCIAHGRKWNQFDYLWHIKGVEWHSCGYSSAKAAQDACESHIDEYYKDYPTK